MNKRLWLMALGCFLLLAGDLVCSETLSEEAPLYTELSFDVSGIICESQDAVQTFIDRNATKYVGEILEQVETCTELVDEPAALFTTVRYLYMDQGQNGTVEIMEIIILDESLTRPTRIGYTFGSWKDLPSD